MDIFFLPLPPILYSSTPPLPPIPPLNHFSLSFSASLPIQHYFFASNNTWRPVSEHTAARGVRGKQQLLLPLDSIRFSPISTPPKFRKNSQKMTKPVGWCATWLPLIKIAQAVSFFLIIFKFHCHILIPR